MKHTMRLNPHPFEMIKNGNKSIELRLYDEKRRAIRIGDEIEFIHVDNESQRILCIVVNMFIFDSFKELYKTLPLNKCGYTETELSGAAYTDMEVYYTIEQQRKYGVVGIEIKLL